METEVPMTPLELIIGVADAEHIYDTLTLRDQIIIDLLSAGWNQTEIGIVLDRSQWTINREVRRIRSHLANTKLRLILEGRMEARETHSQYARMKGPNHGDNDDD